jgi:hypothetical protein
MRLVSIRSIFESRKIESLIRYVKRYRSQHYFRYTDTVILQSLNCIKTIEMFSIKIRACEVDEKTNRITNIVKNIPCAVPIEAVLGIRIRMFFGIQDPEPDPPVRDTDPFSQYNACKIKF